MSFKRSGSQTVKNILIRTSSIINPIASSKRACEEVLLTYISCCQAACSSMELSSFLLVKNLGLNFYLTGH